MIYRILQLTDTHIFKSARKHLQGVQTNTRLLQVLDFIKNQALQFDSIFLTGDVSQDESIESYEIVATLLSCFNKPVYWIPGNHDNLHKMQSVFAHYPLFCQTTEYFLAPIPITPQGARFKP